MRVLVCGGRDYTNWSRLEAILGELYYSLSHEEQNLFVLIEGGAKGADRLARNFAKKYCYPWSLETYKADWNKYGKRAGYLRNRQMLDEGKPDLVIAFPGGKGTAMMVDIACKAGVEVQIVE